MLKVALLALILPLSASVGAADEAATLGAPASDEALRAAVIGTWLYEKDAGVASAAMYTTYSEDGTALQLIKTKIIFKKARGVLIVNQWRIQNGALHLTPVRYRSHSEDEKVDMQESVRQSLSASKDEMRYHLKGKERTERKVAGIPDDVKQMIEVLSKE